MKMHRALVSALTLAWLTACGPTESDSAPALAGNEIMVTGKGRDNVSWALEAPVAEEKISDGTVVLTSSVLKTAEGKLPGSAGTSRVFCVLSLKVTGVGEFASSSTVNLIVADSSTGKVYDAYPHGNVSIKVTQYDKTGEAESEITGTFSGSIKTAGGDFSDLTGGSFHWKK